MIGVDPHHVLNFWYRRISCTLQKGNARTISSKCIAITQGTTCHRDEYHVDVNIDREYNNNDVMIDHHSSSN